MNKSIFTSHISFVLMALSSLLLSCTASKSSLADKQNYTDDNVQYRKLYTVKFDADEKPLRYGSYYIVSKVPEGYRVRVFHPQKKILVEDKIYSTPSLTLLHGFYESWWDDGSIREQGIYRYGRKNSVWLEHEPGLGKSASGDYLNNQKEGIWTQLDSNGMVEAVYNYQDGKRHGKYYLYDSTGKKINEGLYRSDTLIAELFKQPPFTLPLLKMCISDQTSPAVCTDSKLAQYISETLKYPAKAKQMKLEGSAYAQWEVMPDGSVENIRIPQALSDEIEAECLRALKNMPEWVAARKDGVPIKWTVSLPINFRL
jgi:TonB family protein